MPCRRDREIATAMTGNILAAVGTGSGTGICVRQDLFVKSIKLRQFVCLCDVTVSTSGSCS